MEHTVKEYKTFYNKFIKNNDEESLSLYDFDGEIQTIIDKLLTIQSEGFTHLEQVEGYDDSIEFHIYKKRPETEEETKKRLQKEAERIFKQEEVERQHYESLKKKFERQV